MSNVFRSAYKARPRCQVDCSVGGRTKQSFRDECNVNNILAKYRRQLGVDYLKQYAGYLTGSFGDVSGAVDYQTALEKCSEAGEAFDAMPSKLRSRFENDPARLLAFLSDVSNRQEAIELGLLPVPDPKVSDPVFVPPKVGV